RVGVERSEADAERLRLVRMPAPKGRPAARAEGLGEAVGRLVLADQLGPLEDRERTRFQPRLGRGGGSRPALAAGAVAVARGTEKGRGTHSSHPGSSRTQPSNSSARPTARRIRSWSPARPRQRSTAHSLSERNRRPSAGPYSLRLRASSESGVRRYSGTRLKASRKSSGRAVQSSEQSSGVNSHLCALITSESAISTPSNAHRSSGQTMAPPA